MTDIERRILALVNAVDVVSKNMRKTKFVQRSTCLMDSIIGRLKEGESVCVSVRVCLCVCMCVRVLV